MTSTASSAGHTRPAEARSGDARRRSAWAGGAFTAVGVWIGWMSLSPAVGFPRVSPSEMINVTLRANPGATIGWAVLLGGLVGLATAYLAVASRGLLRPGLSSGTLFGLVLWLLTGAVLMPLMGVVSPERPSAALMNMPRAPSLAPMRETFMMLHLGILAPVGALIAWLLFGTVLGAMSSVLLRGGKAAR